MQSESPSVSDLNALGVYLLTSLCFVVGALIEFAVVLLLDRPLLNVTKRKENRIENQQHQRFYSDLKQRKHEDLSREGHVTKWISDVKPNKQNLSTKPKKSTWVFFVPSVNGVDFVACWAYLFLYLLFNCIYWVQYTTFSRNLR